MDETAKAKALKAEKASGIMKLIIKSQNESKSSRKELMVNKISQPGSGRLITNRYS